MPCGLGMPYGKHCFWPRPGILPHSMSLIARLQPASKGLSLHQRTGDVGHSHSQSYLGSVLIHLVSSWHRMPFGENKSAADRSRLENPYLLSFSIWKPGCWESWCHCLPAASSWVEHFPYWSFSCPIAKRRITVPTPHKSVVRKKWSFIVTHFT